MGASRADGFCNDYAGFPLVCVQLLVHRDWFLADMGFQIITIGTTAHQTAKKIICSSTSSEY